MRAEFAICTVHFQLENSVIYINTPLRNANKAGVQFWGVKGVFYSMEKVYLQPMWSHLDSPLCKPDQIFVDKELIILSLSWLHGALWDKPKHQSGQVTS